MTGFDYHDTIAAISTPPGVGGIAVIRLSGSESRNIALKVLDINSMSVRYAHFSRIVNPESFEIIDEVVAIFFKAPASYTGEDIVEISCHGGYAAAPAILELLYRYGARPALPGEFTRRAFINGKMDLLQAEAVADLIHAVSDSGKKIASRTLDGKLSEKVHSLRQELMDIASVLELELDFSEQEITTLDHNMVAEKIKKAKEHITTLHNSYSSGKIQREGALVPIAGRPNAGKSSLLNALLEEERAIISHIPGTTRDTIEESFIHDGVAFRLVDTAGLRKTEDPIEKMGANRAKKILDEADLILLVVDLGDANNLDFERSFLAEYSDLPLIVVYNKSDLYDDLPDIGPSHSIAVSALKHQHIDDLVVMMSDMINNYFNVGGETIAITKERHKNALRRAIDALDRTLIALNENMSNEFLALDIKESINALDDITGQTTSEDVLNNIFDQFCIGK